MTPGIKIAEQAKIAHKVHEYSHDPASDSYGLEASTKLGVDQARVFKTLLVNLDNKELAVGIIPVSSMLSMKLIAKATGAKKAKMAEQADVERSTGYVLGGVSPLGQKKKLKTILDSSAMSHSTIFVSGGRRGLEIELSPDDLVRLTHGALASITQ